MERKKYGSTTVRADSVQGEAAAACRVETRVHGCHWWACWTAGLLLWNWIVAWVVLCSKID